MNSSTGDYLGIPFYRSHGPARPHLIRHVEVAMQAQLPPDYKTFLAVTDGCYFGLEDGWEEWGFPVPEGMDFFRDVIDMAYMRSVNPGDSVLGAMSGYDFYKRVPPGILPVGNNSYDDYVCL
jgi:hypothetical protein